MAALSDSLGEDVTRGAARAQQEALKRLTRPSVRAYTGGATTGDGDPCPLDPEHGKMLTIAGTKKQYCPHQSHDGKAGEGQTRAIWPLEDGALARAVEQEGLKSVTVGETTLTA